MTAADLDLERAGIESLQQLMTDGDLTSEALTTACLDRIERLDPRINAIRRLAADAVEQARARDEERAAGDARGPMHGVPVCIKDNIDVAGMPTTAGTLALESSTPGGDAGLVSRLRDAGAVILGKANLTELANFMADDMPSGYSSLGGQVLNPYDTSVTPCGSSSGSGAAVAAGLVPVAVGSETDGSILCPCDAQSLVGVKPTLGLVSGQGILPIAASQDCAGPMAKTVYDAAALLGAMTGHDYVSALVTDMLDDSVLIAPALPENNAELALDDDAQTLYAAALDVLRDRGARVVEVAAMTETEELDVLHYEFARDLGAYLGALPDDAPIRSVAALVQWNKQHADAALKFGQVHLEKALAIDLDEDKPAYTASRARDLAVAATHGVDALLSAHSATAIVMPSWRGSGVGARAGYPSVIVPAGYRAGSRRPFGVAFLGSARSEAILLSLALDYERTTSLWRPPSEINPSFFRNR